MKNSVKNLLFGVGGFTIGFVSNEYYWQMFIKNIQKQHLELLVDDE